MDRIYSGLELGLSEYKNRKIDWDAYEENKLIDVEVKKALQEFENKNELMPDNGYIIFSALRELKDFVARIKILLYAERYLSVAGSFDSWKKAGFPSLDLLLLDCVSLNLEAYQKCKVLLILSDNGVAEATESLLSFLKHCCSGDGKDELLLGSLWLQFYLENPSHRKNFVQERFDFVNLIVLRLRTFKSNNCAQLLRVSEIITTLIDVAKLAVKEKVVRLVVSSLSNFLRQSKKLALPLFVGSKVQSFVTTLKSRPNTDQEFLDDLNYLEEELNCEIQKLSTFDEYASEIKSGQLEWSPTHKSELFWFDNATKLEDHDLEILRQLSKILSECEDPVKLSIACHDIGQYIEHAPHGKKNVEKIGIKQNIMRLISHQDSEVRYFALNAVQKYMTNLWSAI